MLATEQTHVVHLATVKETPDLVMDVTVKGLFQLLEVARESPTVGFHICHQTTCTSKFDHLKRSDGLVRELQFKQFMLIGGDAGMGHFFYKVRCPSCVLNLPRMP